MFDFSFAIPSILILSILLANYFLLKRLPLKVNGSFVMLLLVETIVISADIISSWACENYADLPLSVVVISNMIFFIFFGIRGFAFFAYTCDFLGIFPHESKIKTFLCQLPLIICEILVLSSPWTKAIFYIDSDGYHRGSVYMASSYIFYIYILF